MAQPLILHGMNSPNVRKVVIALEEFGLAYELRHVAVFKGAQFAPEFLALNPMAKVPVLVDPRLGAPLAESGAILIWLAEQGASIPRIRGEKGHPQGGSGVLLPESGPARYEILQWLMVQMASIGPMLGQLNHFQILPGETETYARGRYREQAKRLYRLLDDRLASREWIAGDGYSIADIAIFPWADYLERHGFDPARHRALLRWRDRIAARPAVERAAARMDAAFTAISTETRKAATPADLDLFFGRGADMPAADFSAVTR